MAFFSESDPSSAWSGCSASGSSSLASEECSDAAAEVTVKEANIVVVQDNNNMGTESNQDIDTQTPVVANMAVGKDGEEVEEEEVL